MSINCPPRESLADFAFGKLDADTLQKVSTHIEDCSSCQQVLQDFTNSSDSFVGKIQAAVFPTAEANVNISASLSWSNLHSTLIELGVASDFEMADLALKLEMSNVVDLVSAAMQHLTACGKLTTFQSTQISQGKASSLRFGDYVVKEEIGAGGMGQVFKAVHRTMKRDVALKVVTSHLPKSTDALRRFEREIVAAGKLVHANIVTAFDAGRRNDDWYLVMEYVPGQDLSRVLVERGPLSIPETIRFVSQAARGLAFAHGRGMVHRDIKPSNLLVDSTGIVKILDLGLARFDKGGETDNEETDDALTQRGQVMGTADYMAPEQALDTSQADSKADVYSLGCTLYRLLTNRPVYIGDTLVKKLLAHREQPIPSLRDLRPDSSTALDYLFQRMIAKRPEDRPTAAFVADALESLLVASPAEGGPDLTASVTPYMASVTGAIIAPSMIDASEQQGDLKFRLQGRWPSSLRFAAGGIGSILVCSGLWLLFRNLESDEFARQRQLEPSVPLTTNTAPAGQSGNFTRPSIQGQGWSPLTGNPKQVHHPDDFLSPSDRLKLYRDRIKAAWPGREAQLNIGPMKLLELRLSDCEEISDLTPLSGMKLQELNLVRCKKVQDLSPLREMPLVHLNITGSDYISDISPLANLPIESLSLSDCRHIKDLSVLETMPLRHLSLDCDRMPLVTIKARPLRQLRITKASDLSPLAGMKVESLSIASGSFSDLSPLSGMRLTQFEMLDCPNVTDVTPLADMPLKHLGINNCPLVRELPPFKDMQLTGLTLRAYSGVRSLTPLTGMPLTMLTLGPSPEDTRTSDIIPNHITDIRALVGMPLARCYLRDCVKVEDFTVIAGLPLSELHLPPTATDETLLLLKHLKLSRLIIDDCVNITSLTAIALMPLEHLNITNCKQVADLSPLSDLKLKSLWICGTSVTDLTPLQDMRLAEICFTPAIVTQGVEVLRRMPSLQIIGVDGRYMPQRMPVSTFWKRYDAGDFDSH